MNAFEYFMQSADASFQRKQDLFNQILQSILQQEVMGAGQKTALVNLARGLQVSITEKRASLDRLTKTVFDKDAELEAIREEGKIDYGQDVLGYGIRAYETETKAEAGLREQRMENAGDILEQEKKLAAAELESVNQEAIVASEKAAKWVAAKGLVLNGQTPTDAADQLAAGAAAAWQNEWSAGYARMPSQAARDEYVRRFDSWAKEVYAKNEILARRGESNAGVLVMPETMDAMSIALAKYGVPSAVPKSAATSSSSLEGQALAGTNVKSAPKPAALDRLHALERERYADLLGLPVDSPELEIDFTDKAELTAAEDYLLRAAYNRLQYNPDATEREADLAKYKTYKDYVEGIKNGLADVVDDVKAARGLSVSSLKLLHEGSIASERLGLKEDEARLKELTDKLSGASDRDPAEVYTSAVEKARDVYRRLYGPNAMREGVAVSDQIQELTAGMSPLERAELIHNMPVSDRRKEALLHASSGRATDKDLVILRQRAPALDLGSAANKLLKYIPGELLTSDGDLIVKNSDGTVDYIPPEVATITDLARAVGSGADPDTRKKLEEAASLFSQLTETEQLARLSGKLLTEFTGMVSSSSNKPETVLEDLGKHYQPVPDPSALPLEREAYKSTMDRWDVRNKSDMADKNIVDGPEAVTPPTSPVVPVPPTTPVPRPAVIDLTTKPKAALPFDKSIEVQALAAAAVGPDAIRTASSKVASKLGRDPTAREVTAGVTDGMLAGFNEKERKLLADLARQSSEAGVDGMEQLSKVFNPLQSPSKYERAARFLAMTRDPRYQDLDKRASIAALRNV